MTDSDYTLEAYVEDLRRIARETDEEDEILTKIIVPPIACSHWKRRRYSVLGPALVRRA